jgi:hypothetical protein
MKKSDFSLLGKYFSFLQREESLCRHGLIIIKPLPGIVRLPDLNSAAMFCGGKKLYLY